MKTKILIIASLLIGVPEVHAQPSTRFAVKLGINSSIQSIGLPASERRIFSYEFHRRIGLEGAFGIEYFALTYLSVATQIEYSQRGTGESRQPAYPSSTIQYHRIEYISIPLIVRFTLTSRKPHPSLFIGPKIDFPIGYRGVSDDILSYVYDNLKRPSYGLFLGIGFEPFPASLMEFRYEYDLGNASTSEDYIVKSNALHISLAYLI